MRITRAVETYPQPCCEKSSDANKTCGDKQSPTRVWLDNVREQICQCDKLCTELEARLRAVMNPSKEEGEVQEKSLPEPMPSPLVGELKEFEGRIQNINYRITNILSGLEI